MKHLQTAAGASLLALAAATFALPASAQSTGGTMPQNSGSQSSSPSTGALPDNSLAGQRQGTVGGTATQGGGQSGTSGSSAGSSGTTTYGSPGASPGTGASSGTGALPDNSLAGQRQGTIGGGSVSQGGNNSGPPKQGTGQ